MAILQAYIDKEELPEALLIRHDNKMPKRAQQPLIKSFLLVAELSQTILH